MRFKGIIFSTHDIYYLNNKNLNAYRYDNEYGYAHRVVDLVQYMFKVDSGEVSVASPNLEENKD